MSIDLMERIKKEIFSKTRDFFMEKSKNGNKFIPGKSKIPYAGRVYDEKEMVSLVGSALDFWLTNGRYEEAFCQGLSNFLGVDNIVTVNSGSSANLLAVSALTSSKLGDRMLRAGDEIITVAAGFPTTVTPIVQNRCIPVFVDIELDTYNAEVAKIEEAISSRTKAIFLAHTLGIPFDLEKVMKLAKEKGLWVIEDNCDALGSRYNGKYTGTVGHIGTFSFYPAHHITMGEGGALATSSDLLKQLIISFRDWGRDCRCKTGEDNACGKRFDGQFGTLPQGYDHKYVYSHLGYNLKITEMQAAIGVEQLKKLPFFIEKRKEIWKRFHDFFKKYEDFFFLSRFPKKTEVSPFCFIVTVVDNAPFKRADIVSFLEGRGIQTRMLFAGNMTRQPCMKDVEYRVVGGLDNTDKVMNDTFLLGVYPGLKDEMISYIQDTVEEFIKIQGLKFKGGVYAEDTSF